MTFKFTNESSELFLCGFQFLIQLEKGGKFTQNTVNGFHRRGKLIVSGNSFPDWFRPFIVSNFSAIFDELKVIERRPRINSAEYFMEINLSQGCLRNFQDSSNVNGVKLKIELASSLDQIQGHEFGNHFHDLSCFTVAFVHFLEHGNHSFVETVPEAHVNFL